MINEYLIGGNKLLIKVFVYECIVFIQIINQDSSFRVTDSRPHPVELFHYTDPITCEVIHLFSYDVPLFTGDCIRLWGWNYAKDFRTARQTFSSFERAMHKVRLITKAVNSFNNIDNNEPLITILYPDSWRDILFKCTRLSLH
jgi:hypothetical protein